MFIPIRLNDKLQHNKATTVQQRHLLYHDSASHLHRKNDFVWVFFNQTTKTTFCNCISEVFFSRLIRVLMYLALKK